jgi:hypothetical protein
MTQDTLADLARLRAIAEEGRRMPLLGGRHLILWGSVVALASLFHGAIVAKILPLPAISIAVTWFGLMGTAAIVGRSAAFRKRKPSQALDVGNRLERGVWQVGGTFFGLISVGVFLRGLVHQQLTGDASLFMLFELMPAITFGVYAIILRAAAEASGIKQLKHYSWASLALVIVTIVLIHHPLQFVATAIGIFGVSVLPGRLLLRLETDSGRG